MSPADVQAVIWLLGIPGVICLIIGITLGVVDSPYSSDKYARWLITGYVFLGLVYLVAIFN